MDGFNAPGSAGETVFFVIALAVIIGLYILTRRTYRRWQDQYWERHHSTEEVPEEEVPAVPIADWNLGDPVWIVDGPYAKLKGIVAEIRPQRDLLIVEVDVYGRSTPVELTPGQVLRARSA